MTNLNIKIEQLRKEMEKMYHDGERPEALALSQRLDKLIALAQREAMAQGNLTVCLDGNEEAKVSQS